MATARDRREAPEPGLSWLLVAFVLLVPSRALASPVDLFGYGARSAGMAMTGSSFANDHEATYQNPAGLAAATHSGLFLGMGAAFFRLRLDGAHAPLEASRGLVIGFQLPIPFGGPLEGVLTVGGGFFTPTNTVLQTDALFAEVPRFAVLARAQVVAAQFGLGIDLERLVRGLRLGIGVSATANTAGDLHVRLDAGNRFVSQVETQITSRFAPTVGAQLERERFSLGFTYRAEIDARIALDIVVSDLPITLPTLTIDALAQYDPHVFVFEGSWLANARLRLVAQLAWRRWSRYPGALGSTTEQSNPPPAPDFHDTVTPRIALEHVTSHGANRFVARAGYAFEPTPAPRARLAPALDASGSPRVDDAGNPVFVPVRTLDNHRHVLTGGFGWVRTVPGAPRVRVDAYAQLHVLEPRTHDVPAEGSTRNMRTSGVVPAFGFTTGLEW